MAIVVIGGQSRDIGKTSIVCGLIAALPDRCWTAIKITQCKHGEPGSEVCDCKLAGRTVAISEERDAGAATDSSRYLAAGATRSLWVRTRRSHLAEAMPQIREEIARAPNVIVESNSVLRYLDPDLYVVVLDPAVADFKPSARRYLDRADAILVPAGAKPPHDWFGISPERVERIPAFSFRLPRGAAPEFVAFVDHKLKSAAPRLR